MCAHEWDLFRFGKRITTCVCALPRVGSLLLNARQLAAARRGPAALSRGVRVGSAGPVGPAKEGPPTTQVRRIPVKVGGNRRASKVAVAPSEQTENFVEKIKSSTHKFSAPKLCNVADVVQFFTSRVVRTAIPPPHRPPPKSGLATARLVRPPPRQPLPLMIFAIRLNFVSGGVASPCRALRALPCHTPHSGCRSPRACSRGTATTMTTQSVAKWPRQKGGDRRVDSRDGVHAARAAHAAGKTSESRCASRKTGRNKAHRSS